MSEKCHQCEHCTEVPDSALCVCEKKHVSLLEPIEFLYMHMPCEDFLVRATERPFLDANHHIANIPEHHIEKIDGYNYPLPPMTDAAIKRWFDSLWQFITRAMERYEQGIIRKYGHFGGLSSVREDVCTNLRAFLKHFYYSNYSEYPLTEECQKTIFLSINNYLVSFQCRVWKLIRGENA